MVCRWNDSINIRHEWIRDTRWRLNIHRCRHNTGLLLFRLWNNGKQYQRFDVAAVMVDNVVLVSTDSPAIMQAYYMRKWPRFVDDVTREPNSACAKVAGEHWIPGVK